MRGNSILKIIITCIVLFLVCVGVDRLTALETTDAMHERARIYAVESGKQLPPNAFIGDGCTLFPEKIFGSDWTEACLAHDISYWVGGTDEERKSTDQTLRDSVANTGTMGKLLATPMYVGVRIWGNTWLTRLFDANWGFGWNT